MNLNITIKSSVVESGEWLVHIATCPKCADWHEVGRIEKATLAQGSPEEQQAWVDLLNKLHTRKAMKAVEAMGGFGVLAHADGTPPTADELFRAAFEAEQRRAKS